jgi:hypothetical protein
MGNTYIQGLGKPRRQGLDKPGYNGLKAIRRQGLEGLSIIYITAFDGLVQIMRQFIPNLKMGISPFAQYHQRKGLSSLSQYVRRFQTTVYKRYTNIPSSKQTISSGYKGLDIWPNIRFG